MNRYERYLEVKKFDEEVHSLEEAEEYLKNYGSEKKYYLHSKLVGMFQFILKQKQYASMDVYDQVLQLFTAKHRFIKSIPLEKIAAYEEDLLVYMHTHHQDLIDAIKAEKKISDDVEKKLKEVIGKYTEDYMND